MQPQFKLGQVVKYKGNVGRISFIDNIYVTVCITPNSDGRSVGDICLVVYSAEWPLLTPLVVNCEEVQRRGC